MLDLGGKAKAKGKYLLGWGKEAATYYQTMAIASAIKEGGDEVRLALENLKPDCWSLPAVQAVFTGLKKIIDAGYIKPGGAGTQFTAAQAQWSNAQDFILYPSGGWIENEMKKDTKDGFKMTGAPEPTVTSGSKMPWEALHSTAGEGYIVPSKAKNVGRRQGVPSRHAVARRRRSTSRRRSSPRPSSRARSPRTGSVRRRWCPRSSCSRRAGTNIFSWNFVDLYGMNDDQLVVWNTFLQGGSDVATLTPSLQAITDKVANDHR